MLVGIIRMGCADLRVVAEAPCQPLLAQRDLGDAPAGVGMEEGVDLVVVTLGLEASIPVPLQCYPAQLFVLAIGLLLDVALQFPWIGDVDHGSASLRRLLELDRTCMARILPLDQQRVMG